MSAPGVTYLHVFAKALVPLRIETATGTLEVGNGVTFVTSPGPAAAAWRAGLVEPSPFDADGELLAPRNVGADLRGLWERYGSRQFSRDAPLAIGAIAITEAPIQKVGRSITLNFGGGELGETAAPEAPREFR